MTWLIGVIVLTTGAIVRNSITGGVNVSSRTLAVISRLGLVDCAILFS